MNQTGLFKKVRALFIKDKEYYETSGGGVTFSGGECMLQIDFLCEALKKCKENGVHTAVDTAGSVSWESFEKILPYTDLFLYDVKCIDEQKHIQGTGVSNRQILKNLEKLSTNFNGDIIIRIPVITGFNDSEEEMKKISDFLKNIYCKDIELLPYHKMGEHKYDALGLKCTSYKVPTEQRIEEFKAIM